MPSLEKYLFRSFAHFLIGWFFLAIEFYKFFMNVGEDVEKGNFSALLVGMQIGAATVESSMEIPQKIKNGTAL